MMFARANLSGQLLVLPFTFRYTSPCKINRFSLFLFYQFSEWLTFGDKLLFK